MRDPFSNFRSALEPEGERLEEEESGFPGDRPMQTIGHVIKPLIDGIELAMKVSLHTESPIETMLAVAILRQWPDVEFRTYDAGPARGWTLIPQYPWGKYRVDLALRKPDGYLIFIECDGKDFHSSPEQVERDMMREQLMLDAGYPVVRFTGADINYSPVACANEMRRFRRWGT